MKAPLLTSDVSRQLKISSETVRAWARCGRLKSIQTPRGVRIFDADDVDREQRELERQAQNLPGQM
jgi:DNA-binding transcriptional MerR regulator